MVATVRPRAANLEVLRLRKPWKPRRRGDFVHQVEVDIEQRGRAGLFVDNVRVPEFFDDSDEDS